MKPLTTTLLFVFIAVITFVLTFYLLSLWSSADAAGRQPMAHPETGAGAHPLVLSAAALDRVTAGTTFQFNPNDLTLQKSASWGSSDSSTVDDTSSTYIRVQQLNTDGGL